MGVFGSTRANDSASAFCKSDKARTTLSSYVACASLSLLSGHEAIWAFSFAMRLGVPFWGMHSFSARYMWGSEMSLASKVLFK